MKCKISYVAEIDLEKELEEEGFDITEEFMTKFKANMTAMKDELKEDLDKSLPCKDEQSTLTIEFIEDEETINE